MIKRSMFWLGVDEEVLKTYSSWKTLLYRTMSRSYVVIGSNKGECREASYTLASDVENKMMLEKEQVDLQL